MRKMAPAALSASVDLRRARAKAMGFARGAETTLFLVLTIPAIFGSYAAGRLVDRYGSYLADYLRAAFRTRQLSNTTTSRPMGSSRC